MSDLVLFYVCFIVGCAFIETGGELTVKRGRHHWLTWTSRVVGCTLVLVSIKIGAWY